MNTAILNEEVQEFINSNLKTDITKLILKGSPFKNITIQELAEQIEAKKKCEKKLPTWFNTNQIYYPNKLNIEQTSSEITANYKSQLVKGKSIVDITGGFGVDSYYFAKHFKQVYHCDLNEELSKIATLNFQKMNVTNIVTLFGNGIDFVINNSEKFDCIFIDPSRRDEAKNKVFFLKDCLPNVPQFLDVLFEKSNSILLKASPILDIKSAINDLKFTKEVHVVAVNNEVKELLFLLKKGYSDIINFKTVNFQKNIKQSFQFSLHDVCTPIYAKPKKYLYEPNFAILKAGAFQQLSAQLKVAKLHKHSHLYTSDELLDFPGRSFIIKNIINYDVKKLKKLIPSKKANITIRNFPETVAQIRNKTKLKDGGNQYLFFTTDCFEKHIVIICDKISICNKISKN